ncbi:hypothetical protein A3Q56_04215 [Intoshia linei]|uniref:RecQ-like DNA helicase BLM n=1 Tax=Intoshia linei TaxID=1819745 RepID=A0A177B360_9BILA|nr:hypothetical protein A3Q56_04215 [Intoshia linei]
MVKNNYKEELNLFLKYKEKYIQKDLDFNIYSVMFRDDDNTCDVSNNESKNKDIVKCIKTSDDDNINDSFSSMFSIESDSSEEPISETKPNLPFEINPKPPSTTKKIPSHIDIVKSSQNEYIESFKKKQNTSPYFPSQSQTLDSPSIRSPSNVCKPILNTQTTYSLDDKYVNVLESIVDMFTCVEFKFFFDLPNFSLPKYVDLMNEKKTLKLLIDENAHNLNNNSYHQHVEPVIKNINLPSTSQYTPTPVKIKDLSKLRSCTSDVHIIDVESASNKSNFSISSDDYDVDIVNDEAVISFDCGNSPPFKKSAIVKTKFTDLPPPKFYGYHHSDGNNDEFKSNNHHFSVKMLKIFRKVFGLSTFRYNQQEAINCALLNYDCFILMPTGGGKSICYQLPALVTEGITIVISPLLSLINDQVVRLKSLGINAEMFTGSINAATRNSIFDNLQSTKPSIRLLYVTPEMIAKSEKFSNVCQNLYDRNLLDRLVIDEAHCISQWGHDFRPDYQKIKHFRHQFTNLSVMALTATATSRVRKEILLGLGAENAKWFVQSFNRKNLIYQVLNKKMKTIKNDISSRIKAEFSGLIGIVYCRTRDECENMSEHLNSENINSKPYHAGLSDDNRTGYQASWLNDETHVLCATLAFGMGIDKPDVRFVFHATAPKSIESYYQESGRAGRDGKLATCAVYYNYADIVALRRMINRNEIVQYNTKPMHLKNLYEMVQYCDSIDCRRMHQLHYFGEIFNKDYCGYFPGAKCDNCRNRFKTESRNITNDIKIILTDLRTINLSLKITLNQLCDIFKGSKNQNLNKFNYNNLSMHGLGKSYPVNDCSRLFRKLVCDFYLGESFETIHGDFVVSYVHEGVYAKEILTEAKQFHFDICYVNKSSKSNAQTPGVHSMSASEELTKKCYNELRTLDKAIAKEQGNANNRVFDSNTLCQLADVKPCSYEDIKSNRIDGFTKYRYEKYGERFLTITKKYFIENKNLLESNLEERQERSYQASLYSSKLNTTSNNSYGGQNSYKPKYTKFKKNRYKKTDKTKKSKKPFKPQNIINKIGLLVPKPKKRSSLNSNMYM